MIMCADCCMAALDIVPVLFSVFVLDRGQKRYCSCTAFLSTTVPRRKKLCFVVKGAFWLQMDLATIHHIISSLLLLFVVGVDSKQATKAGWGAAIPRYVSSFLSLKPILTCVCSQKDASREPLIRDRRSPLKKQSQPGVVEPDLALDDAWDPRFVSANIF